MRSTREILPEQERVGISTPAKLVARATKMESIGVIHMAGKQLLVGPPSADAPDH
jgi:hypothetical protein